MNIEYTGTVPVWNSSPSYKTLSEVKKLIEAGEADRVVSYFHFTGADMQDNGWVHIGNAVVTVTLFDEAELHSKQLDALKAELKTARAEAQQRENAILDRISKLQALTFDAQEVA